MNILLVESRYENSEDLDKLYNSFSDADIDVYTPDELDFEGMSEDYDVVLSELSPGYGFTGTEILNQFEAEKKAIYTVWQEDGVVDNPELSGQMQEHEVISKPGPLNLESLVEKEL